MPLLESIQLLAFVPSRIAVHASSLLTSVSVFFSTKRRSCFHAAGLWCGVVLGLGAATGAAHAQAEVVTVMTRTTIAASANPTSSDGFVTFTAKVDADPGAVPGGNIDFFDEDTRVCLGRADVASPSLTVSHLAPGVHRISAYYTGTVAFLPFAVMPSSSAALIETVQAEPRLEVSTSQNPSVPGEVVTLHAVVSARSGVPTGMVTFRDGDIVLAANIKLDHGGGVTFVTTALSDGAHAISAEYEGDAAFAKAVATVRQDVSTDQAAETFRIGQFGTE